MVKTVAPDQHIAAARSRLAHLQGLAETTAETERRILSAATERRETMGADIGKLRRRVDLDPSAADRYQELIAERGRLDTVIAQASQALAQ